MFANGWIESVLMLFMPCYIDYGLLRTKETKNDRLKYLQKRRYID